MTIKNTDIDTLELIPGSKFKLTGKGFEEGKIISTDSNGEVSLSGLYLNSEYTIEQMSSINHLELANSFKFRLIRFYNGEIKILKETNTPYVPNTSITISGEGFRHPNSTFDSNSTYGGVDEAYFEYDLSKGR